MIEKPFPFVKKRRQADVSPCQSGFLPTPSPLFRFQFFKFMLAQLPPLNLCY